MASIPHSEIIAHGNRTGKIIRGAILEAALVWHDLLLAFVTDDIPQEDTLRIYLLDQRFNVIDTATLSGMYSTGSFRELTLTPPDTLNFRFIGDVVWTLRLLPGVIFKLPMLTDPPGVHRPLSCYRRFTLAGNPKPELV